MGLDTGPAKSDVFTTDIPLPAALVLAPRGAASVSRMRSACDLIVSIPISGEVESLNVATAGSIALFELARRTFEQAQGRRA